MKRCTASDYNHVQEELIRKEAALAKIISKISGVHSTHGTEAVTGCIRPSSGVLDKHTAHVMRALLYIVAPTGLTGEKDIVSALAAALPFSRNEGDGVTLLCVAALRSSVSRRAVVQPPC